MKVKFTKMQGAGNDFVVLDESRGLLGLSKAQYRFLADRHVGVGADQILSVRPAPSSEVDFAYVIHNADGGEVEHCGNGARCFVRFARERGLTDKTVLKVQTMNRVLTLTMQADGRVTVDMGAPVFELDQVPFDAAGLQPKTVHAGQTWPLHIAPDPSLPAQVTPASVAVDVAVDVAVLSMGNPHAVQVVADVDTAPVLALGPLIEGHQRFPKRVNAGFMQVLYDGLRDLGVRDARIQAEAFGGLDTATRRRIKTGSVPKGLGSTVAPGTVITRDFRGVTHQVVAIDGGFQWQGRTFTTLSAVAFAVTGTKRSGQLFFGLKGKAGV